MAGMLHGRVAVITGASSGIGAGVARKFAAEGARLVVAAQDADRLSRIAEELRGLGAEVLARPTDVTQEDQVIGLFAEAEAFGAVDLLVNNAGIAVHRPTLEVTRDDWQKVIDVNLTGAFLCAREALRVMKERRRGKIITIGSLSADRPRADAIAYTASKFGVEGLTRALAIEGREFGVTASIIHPGNTATELVAGMDDSDPRQMMPVTKVAEMIALMASMPGEINVLTATMLPIGQPYLARG